MRATFLHLAGSRRGQSQTFERWPVRIGTAPDCAIAFRAETDPAVSPHHAEIRLEQDALVLTDVGSTQGTSVNGQRIAETVLRDGDLIEVGTEGPRLRFRAGIQALAQRTRFGEIVSDSRALAGGRATAGPASATRFVVWLARGVVREASWPVKAAALVIALLLLGLVVGIPVTLYRSHRATERAIGEFATRLEGERHSREDLERQVSENRRQLEGFRGGIADLVATLRLERDRHADRLAEIDRKLRTLGDAAGAGERIARAYAGGVALLQGAVTFEDEAGRALRYLGTDEAGRPLRGLGGHAPVSVDGAGPVVRSFFLGTGFLVSRDGALLTTRHVVEPWKTEPAMGALLRLGVRPRLVQLRAFFPGHPDPVPVEVARTSEVADAALLRGDVTAATPPVLPLDLTGREAVAGRAVIVMGYPGGVELLLARVEPAVLEGLMAADPTVDLGGLLERLARGALIQPYLTWGHLADVRAHELTCDVPTTMGGSGGPILSLTGRVIGVNYASARGFEAASFGVPIRFGLALLGQSATPGSPPPRS